MRSSANASKPMWRVHNTDSKEMVFQIGAHPAFNYPDFNASDLSTAASALARQDRYEHSS